MKFLQGIGTFISSIIASILNGIVRFFKFIINSIKFVIQSIVNFFKRKYPKDGLDIAAIFQALIVALITMALIFIFDPFKLDDINQILISGGIAFGLSLVFSFITSLISKGSWTLFQHLLKQFVLFASIALACIFYFQKSIEIESIGIFAVLSLIPTILHLFFNQNMADSKYSSLAEDLNEKLKSVKVGNEPSKTIILQNNKGTNLSLLPNQIISVQEKNGQSTVTWQNLFNIETTTLNISLKAIEASLAGNTQFIKCNPNSLVNIYAIQNTNGDANGLELEIAKTNQNLKVARNKINLVSSLGR